jgi:predicted aspartyl protease
MPRKGQRLLAVSGLIAATWLAGCAEKPGCTMGRATELPLRLESGHLTTTVMLNGMPANMILDTGSSDTVVTREAAARLGLTLTEAGDLAGIGGRNAAYSFTSRSFQIGTLRGGHFDLMVSDFTVPAGKHHADGLLGADFLAAYDVDLDVPEGKAMLFKVVSGCTAPAAVLNEPTYMAKLEDTGNPLDLRPMVIVTIGTMRVKALVDSGSPDTSLFRNTARRLGLLTNDIGDEPHLMTGGVGRHPIFEVRRVSPPMTVGEITVNHLPVSILDQHSDTSGVGMLLGLDFLMRVHAWFSFSSHTLFMQYPPGPSPGS